MYFGPSAVIALWFAGSSTIELIFDETPTYTDNPELLGLIVIGVIAALLYSFVSIWVIRSVSKGYFGKRK